jgi:hypothetical protein
MAAVKWASNGRVMLNAFTNLEKEWPSSLKIVKSCGFNLCSNWSYLFGLSVSLRAGVSMGSYSIRVNDYYKRISLYQGYWQFLF